MENEINKTISYIIEVNITDYLEVNLTKDVKKTLHWKQYITEGNLKRP